MGILIECVPLSVSILPDGSGVVGRTEFPNDVPDSARSYLDASPKKQRYLERRVIRALAGTVAQDLKFPSRHHDPGDRRDYEKALELIKCFATSEEHHTAYVKMLRINARDRLRKYWPCVEAVATALLKHDQLSGESLLQIVRSSSRSNVSRETAEARHGQR
jgi:hypothetical protein